MFLITVDGTAQITKLETVEVSKKDGNKRVPVGEFTAYIPTLADLGITYPEGHLVGQWVDKALKAAALADARNKLISGTANIKAGAKIAQTLAELAAPSENSGEALKQIGELKRAFSAYLDNLGLSVKAVAMLRGCFDSPKTLALQPQPVKEKVLARVDAFVVLHGIEKLTETQISYIERLSSGLEEEEELDLDDL
jgi:hypothetical protein